MKNLVIVCETRNTCDWTALPRHKNVYFLYIDSTPEVFVRGHV